MTALDKDRYISYRDGDQLAYPVAAVKIFAGSLVCVNAAGFLVPGDDAAALRFVGVALEYVDNTAGQAGDLNCRVRQEGVFNFDAISITQAMVGSPMYLRSDHEFDESSTHGIACGLLVAFISATEGEIDIETAVTTPATPLAADDMTVGDPADLYSALTVKGQFQEVMQGVKTAQYLLAPSAITLETGAPTVVFGNGAGDGFTQLTNKELGLRWNNGAGALTLMAARFLIPPDLDRTKNLVLHFLGAIIKAGGAEVDSPTMTAECYFAALGAAMLADANCGGDSAAFSAVQTNKYQEKTVTILAADIPADAAVLTVIFAPTAATLPTDDFVLAGLWAEGTRQALTA